MASSSNRSDQVPAASSQAQPADVRALEAVIEPVLQAVGYELCHVEWAAAPGRRILRVYLDHEGGVTLDDCARVTRIVENALDAAEVAGAGGLGAVLAGPYTLEVSSPGIERPLSRASHFRRFRGRHACVRTHAPPVPGNPQRTFHGEIDDIEADPDRPDDEHAGVLVLRDETGARHRIALPQIRRANLEYEVP